MLTQIIMYIISISSIALGFVALLKQKTYIDSKTKEPTEVELSFFGKIRTNYPALVFVFLGFAAALFTFQKSDIKEKVRWSIHGQMVDTAHRIDDWREGEFKIMPENTSAVIDKNTGAYKIEMDIDKDQSFEDAVKCITYTHRLGIIQFCPREEFQNKSNGKPSFLVGNTNPTRFYKPVLLSNNFQTKLK